MSGSRGQPQKRISKQEKEWVDCMLENNLGPIEAARKIFKWRCEPGSSESKRAVNLKQTSRVQKYIRTKEEKIVRETEAHKLFLDKDVIEWDQLRKYAFDRLEHIRDDPASKAQTRFNAIQTLKKLSDPSKDSGLILMWLNLLWRGAQGHCPQCHTTFPLWQIKNQKLARYWERNNEEPPSEVDETLERRMEILTRSDPRKKPHPGQITALSAEERHIAGKGAARAGKATTLDTLVFTKVGWVKAGDLAVGDVVYNEKGQETKIVALSPIWLDGDWYSVEFDSGDSIVVHENHEWVVHNYDYRAALKKRSKEFKEKRRKKRHPNSKRRKLFNKSRILAPEVLETRHMVSSLKARNGTHTNYAIPVSQSLKLEPQELSLDPWVLGLWLGDGSKSNAQISISHEDEEQIKRLVDLGYSVTRGKSCVVNVSNGLVSQLRQLNVLNNKHIPDNYLYGDIEQRLSLLQGLMDSDGTICKKGKCTFDNTNKNLVDGVEWLVNSLGIKTFRGERVGKLNGVSKKLCYRVWFTTTLPVFKLKRKLERVPIKVKQNQTYHYIKNIRKVPPQVGRCIEVDSPSHLYLVGKNLVPTHNSLLLSWMALLFFLIPGVEIWILARVYEDARSEIEYLKKFLNTLFYPYYNKIIKENFDAKTSELILISKWGSELRVRSAKSKGSITGRELEAAFVAEPGWVPEELYEELRARMSSRLGRIIMFGTPKGYGGILGRMLHARGRDPETGRIIRIPPEKRTLEAGMSWGSSLLSYNLSPSDNPEYVKSELESARMELLDSEYASEFEGLMTLEEGAKFPQVKARHLINLPFDDYSDCVFILGIDQGPKNFAACLIGFNGKKILCAREYFETDEMTMKHHMHVLRSKVPVWIKQLGGQDGSWKLTIFDADPPILNELNEFELEGRPWPTEITFRPKNTRGQWNQGNWRVETYEFINLLAAQKEPAILWDLQHTQLLHDQVMQVQNKPINHDRDGVPPNAKHWVVNDPWRGDHVLDAMVLAVWTVFSKQIEKTSSDPTPHEDPYRELKAAFDYKRRVEEARELTGFTDYSPKDDEIFQEEFGRKKESRGWHFRGVSPYKDY